MISTKIVIPSLIACSLLSFNAIAADKEHTVSFNASAFSHYIWRGFDLNDNNIAIQGGADYEHTSGFYAGVWSSQYDFGGSDDGLEIDIYAGYAMAINNDITLDFSVTSYQYTGDADSTTELKLGVSYAFANVNVHRDIDLDTTYIELNLAHDVYEHVSVGGHFGSNNDGDDSYYDYAFTLSYTELENIELMLGYSGHELDSDATDNKIFAGASYYF